jgi:hypothetical protein
MTPFYGKYRGIVENNVDPLEMGRVQVSVPAVLGEGRLSWAMPCAPFAGPGVGLFVVPPEGANVWVEFEAGDPDYPIWCGGFWGEREAPASPALALTKVLKTEHITLMLDDTPGSGGFTLEVRSPLASVPIKLVCNSAGIELSQGSASIKLDAVTVSINDGALEVT